MDRSVRECIFTVVDTETTGLSPFKGAKLVEIAAVKIYPDLRIVAEKGFSTLINPEKPIPYNAYRIHKISDEDVKDAPKIEEVLPHFSNYIANSVMVAHNAKFDFSFIDYFYRKHGFVCPLIGVVDTIKLAKKLVKEVKSYSLDSLISYFDINLKIPDSYRHRAFYDVLHTAVLFKKLVKILMEKEPDITIGSLLEIASC